MTSCRRIEVQAEQNPGSRGSRGHGETLWTQLRATGNSVGSIFLVVAVTSQDGYWEEDWAAIRKSGDQLARMGVHAGGVANVEGQRLGILTRVSERHYPASHGFETFVADHNW